MRDAFDDWIEEWFGEDCPPWTWPLVIGGPMIAAAVVILLRS